MAFKKKQLHSNITSLFQNHRNKGITLKEQTVFQERQPHSPCTSFQLLVKLIMLSPLGSIFQLFSEPDTVE